MPYIKEEKRKLFEETYCTPQNSGELNYLFTMLCIQYIKEKGLYYTSINDIVGALENCKLEFYRRIVSPYENKKIYENNDIDFYKETEDKLFYEVKEMLSTFDKTNTKKDCPVNKLIK